MITNLYEYTNLGMIDLIELINECVLANLDSYIRTPFVIIIKQNLCLFAVKKVIVPHDPT